MTYGLIENGVVVNLIWLYEGNAGDYPDAVALLDRPVGIGDRYEDGVFYRDGMPVLTPLEAANDIIMQLDAAVVELEYQNILLELGIGE